MAQAFVRFSLIAHGDCAGFRAGQRLAARNGAVRKQRRAVSLRFPSCAETYLDTCGAAIRTRDRVPVGLEVADEALPQVLLQVAADDVRRAASPRRGRAEWEVSSLLPAPTR
jgi:hypothetical protein